MIIGITGKIGSGKHTIASFLESKDFCLIDADQLAHELYSRGSDVWHSLVDVFGKKILNKNYAIERKKLAKIVFADTTKLALLNSLVHPALIKEIKTTVVECLMKNQRKIVIVAALADDLQLHQIVEKLILLRAPTEKRFEWLKHSRELSWEEFIKRDSNQKETEKFDLLLENLGSESELILNVKQNLQAWDILVDD